MKKKCNYRFLAVIFLLSFISCENILKEQPLNFTEYDNFYQNEAQCKNAVNYIYNSLYGFYSIKLLNVSDLSTDLAYFDGNTDPAVYFALSPANPGSAAIAVWNSCYKGIVQANNAINGIQNANIDKTIKQGLLGEASFLRAFYYYMLTSLFGDVPFYFDPVTTMSDQDRIAKIPRMDATKTREMLITDLLQYIDALPTRKPEDSSMQRANKEAALVLLAKLAMWNMDFEQAKSYLLKVREVYGVLDKNRYPIEDTYLSKKNVPENIFEIQNIWDLDGLKKNSGISMYMTPPVVAKTDIFDGVQIPFIGKNANISKSAIPTEYFINLFENIKQDLDLTVTTRDLRQNVILGYDYNGEIFDAVKEGKKPWFGIKFWCPDMDKTADGNNPRVFKYADVILMLAECCNELNEPNEALAYLKEIRIRAGYKIFFTNTDKELITKEIREERARELFGDFQRRFDLVRWGIFYEAIKDNADLTLISGNIKPFHQYLPIPDTEVMRSNGILTNPEYE